MCVANAFPTLRHVVTFSRVGAKRVRGRASARGHVKRGGVGGGVGGEGASSLARANALPQNDFRTEWNRTFSPFCANKQTKRERQRHRE